MKRILSILLAASMVFLLAACGGTPAPASSASSQASAPSEASPSLTPAKANPQDAECAKAIACGLVPDGIQQQLDLPITFRQYSEMLTSLIRMWDENRLPEWEKLISLAAASDQEMRREDGILQIAYAMVLMDAATLDDFYDDISDARMEELNACIQEPSWNYPYFPSWEETAFEWCNANYLWGGFLTCNAKVSKVSRTPIYPYDAQTKSSRLGEPLTRKDAISAVLRLAETDPAILEPDGVYQLLGDVGGYDRSILTDELLHAPSALPEPTQGALPAAWKGVGLSTNKDIRNVYRDFQEADIQFLADNGFNFARIFFDFETLRFPNYPEDSRMVNEKELKELDQLIAWGVQYGVHIQISMSHYMDEDGNGKLDDAMPATREEWQLFQDYWEMLARRYAGISSRYLSFDLCNEIQPKNDGEIAAAKDAYESLAAAIWQCDPKRVLLHSFQGNPNAKWVEAMASIGLAIGCHPYYPQYITTTGYEYAQQNPYATPTWPLPWLPGDQIANGQMPLSISGALSECTLSLHLRSWDGRAHVEVFVNGALANQFDLSGGTFSDGEYVYNDKLFVTNLPKGTQELELWVRGGYAGIDTVLVEGPFGKTTIMPHDVCDYPDTSVPLPLILNPDGTYTNSENRMIDGEEIYLADVLPYLEIAKQYGVGFMVNEFGIFGSNVYWENDLVTAYHDDVLFVALL